MHNNFLKVSGHNGLIRDMNTNAIINTNSVEYENYLNRKETIESQTNQIQQNTNEINNIKQDISEIKEMLLMLLNKGNN